MEDCPVCLDSFNLNVFNSLPCSHKICKNCFPRLRIPICPLCRNPFGDTHTSHDDIDLDPIFIIEIDYDVLDFTSPRQRRRQRNRQRNRQLIDNPRPRNLTPTEPISIVELDDTIIDNRTEQTRKKLPEHKRHKRNQKKRNQISSTWNSLRNQLPLI
tara:strand:+ start:357 stop:827 length:471 start_codon:yes stop_codon:yes gene_type:complete